MYSDRIVCCTCEDCWYFYPSTVKPRCFAYHTSILLHRFTDLELSSNPSFLSVYNSPCDRFLSIKDVLWHLYSVSDRGAK